MSNMSYCRWRNTFLDFQDCLRSIGEMEDEDPENDDPTEFWTNTIGDDERRAMVDLIEATADLLMMMKEIDGQMTVRERECLEGTVKVIAETFGYYKGD